MIRRPEALAGSARLSLIRWRTEWFFRRARCRVASRLFRDTGGDPADSIIVAGVARSGTTWLAEILRAQAPLRIMFEPFHNRHVPGFGGFPFHTYRRPGDQDESLRSFTYQVLSGRIRDPHWVDRQVDCLLPTGRIIKDVRICLILRWIREEFPSVPILFVIRHPCAVVASHHKLGWSTEEDVASMLGQPSLVEDFLLPHAGMVREYVQPHQRTAILWCVSNLVVLNQFRSGGLHALHYEDLVNDPGGAIPALFGGLGRDFDSSVFDRLSRPSLTARRHSAIVSGDPDPRPWESRLTENQISDVMEIVRAFGLDHLYGPNGEPTGVIRGWSGGYWEGSSNSQ